MSNLGALRFVVEASSQQIEAGKEFSIYVKITNPYDLYVTIKNVTTKLPIEFKNITAERLLQERNQLESKIKDHLREKISKKIPEIDNIKKERKERIAEVLKDLARLMPFGGMIATGYNIAQLASASNLRPSEKAVNRIEEIADTEAINEIAKKIDSSENPTEELKSATFNFLNKKLNELEKTSEIILEPGDSTVKVFNLKTNRSILFTPSNYQLHIQIEYSVNQKSHHDTIDYRFGVKSSFYPILVGAVIGSFIGFMLKDIFEEKSILRLIQAPSLASTMEIFFKLIGNSLVSIVAVIAFARKKDAQPFLTIEDFWGGLFVGVVSGYLGKSFFESNVLPKGSGVPRK